MSLINQMLKDLERRRATSINPDGSVLHGVSWPGWREHQSRHGMTAMLILLLCIAIGAVGFVWYQSRQGAALTTAAPAMAVETPPAQKVDRPVHRQAASSAVVAERPIVNLPQAVADVQTTTVAPSEAGGESPDTGQLTTVASIAPVITSAPEVLVTADTRPVESRATGRTIPESNINEDNNSQSTVTKTPRTLSSEQQAEAQYQRALSYYRTNQYSLAEPELRKTLALDVGHVAARELLVAMLIKAGRYTGADTLLAEGLEMFPQQVSLIQLKARMLMQQGNTTAAIQLLAQNDPAIDAEPAYHALRAALYQRSGQHDKAVEIYANLVKLYNDTPAWWIGLAISQEALGQIKPALESYRHAAASKGLSNSLHAYVSGKIRLLGRRSATP